jgi:hypothetical protein
MRLFFCSLAPPLLALLVLGCNTVDPSECWPNTSGGFGGSGTIPIGAGVGATSSGDFSSPPPNGGTPNPCVTPPVSDSPGAGMQGGVCPPAPAGAGDMGSPAPAAGDDAVTLCSAACANKCGSAPHGFSPSVFVFTTTVADDGKDVAGGWQVATTTLQFFRWTSLVPESWECSVTVGMPVRAAAYGVISANQAATMTAQVATSASFVVMNSTPELPPGIYCVKLKSEMAAEFPEKFKGLGAKMMP